MMIFYCGLWTVLCAGVFARVWRTQLYLRLFAADTQLTTDHLSFFRKQYTDAVLHFFKA